MAKVPLSYHVDNINIYFFLGIVVADKCPLVLGKHGARILAMENSEFDHPEAAAALIERPSLALLLKKLPDREGNIIGDEFIQIMAKT